MTIDLVLADAMECLVGPWLRRKDAARLAPRRPGLYAFYAHDKAWTELELAPAFSDQPPYVGKAEKSLNGRDVGTHFASGKTSFSTVRRSLAALLTSDLNLDPVSRNVSSPDGSANFALAPESDARLSQRMEDRLSLAIWVKPDGLQLDAPRPSSNEGLGLL